MKNIIKKLLTVMLTMTLFVGIASTSVFADEHQGGIGDTVGQATLTISNLNNKDQVRVWQIITITYDSSNNTLNYSFTPAAEAYFSGRGINIESFMAFNDNSDGLKEALAGLPAHIQGNRGTTNGKWNKPWTNLDEVEVAGGDVNKVDGVVTVGSDGTIVIKNCKAGGYFVEPCASTVVYQPMFVPIIPYVKEGSSGQGYSYKDATLVAKHTSVSIDKSVKRHGSDTWGDVANVSYSTVDSDDNFSSVDFKTVAAVPTYVFGTNNVLKIEEILPTGFTTTKESVKVYGASTNNEQGTQITNIPDGAIAVSTDGAKVTLDFGSDNYSVVSGYSYIRVEYNATVDVNAKIAEKNVQTEGAEAKRVDNVAKTTYTYSCYPYLTTDVANKFSEDSVSIYTGGLNINKYNSANHEEKLQNATFKLYRKDSNGTASLTVNGESIKVKQIATDKNLKTGADGTYTLAGLSSDATYYLVETVAPSGYKLDNTPIPVTFTLNDLNDSGYFVINIENSKANLSLPTTGATGMVAFTVCGLAIMAASIVILVKTRETR